MNQSKNTGNEPQIFNRVNEFVAPNPDNTGKQSLLKLKLEVVATNTRKYESVNFGTYEAVFDIEDFLKAPNGIIVWERLVNNEAGATQDNRLAFLTSIQIRPKMIFSKPSEDMLAELKKGIQL